MMIEDLRPSEPNAAQITAKKHLKIDMMEILKKMVLHYLSRVLIFKTLINVRPGSACPALTTWLMTMFLSNRVNN